MFINQIPAETDEVLELQRMPVIRDSFGLSGDPYNADTDDIRPELEAAAYIVKLHGWEPLTMPQQRYTAIFFVFADLPGAPIVIGRNRDTGKLEDITER